MGTEPTKAQQHIAQLTDTDPHDWERIPTGTKAYDKGYRWINRVTNQRAKRIEPEKEPGT